MEIRLRGTASTLALGARGRPGAWQKPEEVGSWGLMVPKGSYLTLLLASVMARRRSFESYTRDMASRERLLAPIRTMLLHSHQRYDAANKALGDTSTVAWIHCGILHEKKKSHMGPVSGAQECFGKLPSTLITNAARSLSIFSSGFSPPRQESLGRAQRGSCMSPKSRPCCSLNLVVGRMLHEHLRGSLPVQDVP